ncbi:hypothetical protein [Streptomyces sp. HUAS TT7]|uniref:hypothetical protein n=1 Tax=Streptomyces sp. HUAS TT7 TaxID=3447507 RepID=UPI003F65A26B
MPDALGPVAQVEWDALRSLSRSCVFLRSEWELTRAQSARLMAQVDVVDDLTPDLPFAHYRQAVDEMCNAALASENPIGEITWRHASASAMAGFAVLHRLVKGAPALTVAELKELGGQEPTLGQMCEAFSVPASVLLVAREHSMWLPYDELRERLLAGLRGARLDLTSSRTGTPFTTEANVDGVRLSAASRLGGEPLWEYLVEPVLDFAEQMPYEIVSWLDHNASPGA